MPALYRALSRDFGRRKSSRPKCTRRPAGPLSTATTSSNRPEQPLLPFCNPQAGHSQGSCGSSPTQPQTHTSLFGVEEAPRTCRIPITFPAFKPCKSTSAGTPYTALSLVMTKGLSYTKVKRDSNTQIFDSLFHHHL